MDILPDSRCKVVRRQRWHAGWGCMSVPIFCAHCGADGGDVPERSTGFAFWLCNDCYFTHGHLTATWVMPDEAFWQRIAAEEGFVPPSPLAT